MFANDWRTWVLQATNGFSVYNLDSVAAPVLVKNQLVTGAANTDYSGGAVWFLALAAPYLYVAQADEGLKIYKFTDPADPTKIAWQSTYETPASSAIGSTRSGCAAIASSSPPCRTTTA